MFRDGLVELLSSPECHAQTVHNNMQCRSVYEGTLLLMFLFVRAVEDLFEYHIVNVCFFVATIITDLIIQTRLGTFKSTESRQEVDDLI